MTTLMALTDVGRLRIDDILTDDLKFDIVSIAYGSSGYNVVTPALADPINTALTALVAETFRKPLPLSSTVVETIVSPRGRESIYTSLDGLEYQGVGLGEAGIYAKVTDAGTTGLSIGHEFLIAVSHFGRKVITPSTRFAIKWPVDYSMPL